MCFSMPEKKNGHHTGDGPHPAESVLLHLDFISRTTAKPSIVLDSNGPVPIHIQESLVVGDLLWAVQGFSRSTVWPLPLASSSALQEFGVDRNLDGTVKNFVRDILCIGTHYSTIARFVDGAVHQNRGTLLNNFSLKVFEFLHWFRRFMLSLETKHRENQLTLQRLHSIMMDILPSFEVCSFAVCHVSSKFELGAALLSNLCDRLGSMPKDDDAKRLLHGLTAAIADPVFDMLSQWVNTGTFDDPSEEFMIKIMKDVKMGDGASAYWEGKFKIDSSKTPNILTAHRETILKCGKYWNIIKCCKSRTEEDRRPLDFKPIRFTLNPIELETAIETAFNRASAELLKVMMATEDILRKLRSFKHFFLLDRDDYLGNFFQHAESHLRSPVSPASKSLIASHFEDALRCSQLYQDPYRPLFRLGFRSQDIRATRVTEPRTLMEPSSSRSNGANGERRSGFDSLVMDCNVTFPCNLIITTPAKFSYQLLFKTILHLKFVEWSLDKAWTSQHWAGSSIDTRIRSSLLHIMGAFIRSLLQHFVYEVIEPCWKTLQKEIQSAKTFDQVLNVHTEFVDSLLKDCMLSDRSIATALYAVLTECSDSCALLMCESQDDDGSREGPSFTELKTRFEESVMNLVEAMAEPIANRQTENKLLEAIEKLDFNQYYKSRLMDRMRDSSQTSRRSSDDPPSSH